MAGAATLGEVVATVGCARLGRVSEGWARLGWTKAGVGGESGGAFTTAGVMVWAWATRAERTSEPGEAGVVGLGGGSVGGKGDRARRGVGRAGKAVGKVLG